MTITLVITTVLVLIHARISWGWPLWVLVPLGAAVERRRARMEEPLEAAMERTQEHLASGGLRRVPGLAVYLSPSPTLAPAGLRINLRANRALHEKVLVLHVETSETPHLPEEQRVTADQTALRFRLPLDHTLEVGSTLRM